MGDIFDQVAQSSGDVFDQVARGDVRTEIARRKANPPPTATGDPNAIPQSTLETYLPFVAHPVETGKGFVGAVAGGINALAHPVQTVQNDAQARADAYQRMLKRGLTSDDPEQLRDAVRVMLPLVGPAFAQIGDQLNSQNPQERARGTGAGLAMVAGPEMVKDALGAAIPTKEAAAAQYQRVVDPKNLNPQLAGQVSQEMLDKGIKMRNPQQDIASYAEGRATAGDQALTAAVGKMPNLDANAVASALQKVRDSLYNPDTGAPLRPDSDAIAAKIDAYSANHVLGNSKAFVNPQGQATFQMEPQVALELKRAFDKKPYGQGSETGAAEAQGAVGNALRDQFNANPDVANANAQIGKYLTVKNEIAPSAAKDTLPSVGDIASPVVKAALAESLGSALPTGHMLSHGVAGYYAATAIYKLVADTVRSPLWQTASAVTKAKFAKAIAAKDLGSATEVSGRILSGDKNNGQ